MADNDRRARVPGFAVKSPAKRPAQAHAASENAGDTLAFQNHHRGGNGDQNAWVFFDRIGRPSSGIHIVLGHWSTMGKDGFTHYHHPKKGLVKMTLRQKHKPKRLWNYGDVMRCRKRNGQKPIDLRQAVRHGKRVNFLPIIELKDPRFGKPAVAREMVAIFRRNDVACWPKALTNLSGFKAKVYAFGAAGVIIGAIGGKKGQAHKKRTVAQARAQRWRYQPHSW